MDNEQSLKILRMVQEGFLSPEQGQRLLQELSGPAAEPSPAPDLFRLAEEAGRALSQGVERLLGGGPQTISLRVIDLATGAERFQLNLPYQVFTVLKPLLLQNPPLFFQPVQNLDFAALFRALEAGQGGRVFESVDHGRGERLEVWVS